MKPFKRTVLSRSAIFFFLQLSDFDVDVKLLLDALVEKAIEQSLVEVMEEEELAMMGAQQRAFEDLRNYQLAELKRLEEREKRRQLEKVGTLSLFYPDDLFDSDCFVIWKAF